MDHLYVTDMGNKVSAYSGIEAITVNFLYIHTIIIFILSWIRSRGVCWQSFLEIK